GVSPHPPAQKSHSVRHIAILGLGPAAIDRPQRTIQGETLLGRHRNQLVCPLTKGYVLSIERNQPGADRQARSQRRRMRPCPSLSDRCVTLCQCLSGVSKTEKCNPQERL